MKSLNLQRFSLIALVLAGSAGAADILPEHDPFPLTPETVAVPTESSSYYSVAGFRDQIDSTTTAPSESAGGDGALAFCHSDRWSTACLTGLIIYRCGQYTFPLTPYGCALAATAFVGGLEMQRIDVVVEDKTYSLPVIFTARIERLIQDRNIQMDLASLRSLLVDSAKNKTKFDLWQWSAAMTNGNFEKTLENLAVLLQDTSAVEIQINYLKGVTKARRFNAATTKAIADLEEISYQLNYEILRDGDWQSRLHLYPGTKNIDAEATPLIYHFYPMAYTALKLRQAGFGSRLSSFIPFLFNTEYLNQTLDPADWPIHHPKPFKLDSDFVKWKMRDMYAGYAGALWGVRKTSSLRGLISFETEYAKAPYETMRRRFWTMPNP